MRLIVCVDDRNGMLFGGRRQSRDCVVCQQVVEIATNSKLWMNAYSAKLFSDYSEKILVDDDFLSKAEENDFCFVESNNILSYLSDISSIILFKWNRHYPADKYFPIDLNGGGWKLCNSANFAGKSHENITMEEYRR